MALPNHSIMFGFFGVFMWVCDCDHEKRWFVDSSSSSSSISTAHRAHYARCWDDVVTPIKTFLFFFVFFVFLFVSLSKFNRERIERNIAFTHNCNLTNELVRSDSIAFAFGRCHHRRNEIFRLILHEIIDKIKEAWPLRIAFLASLCERTITVCAHTHTHTIPYVSMSMNVETWNWFESMKRNRRENRIECSYMSSDE